MVLLGPLRPTDLAARMKIDASTLTRNLQALVTAGWVEQGPGDDARSRSVVATEAGRAKRAEAQRAWKRRRSSPSTRAWATSACSPSMR